MERSREPSGDDLNAIEAIKLELDGIRAAMRISIAQSQVLFEAVQSLCLTHQDPSAVLHYMRELSDVSIGTMLYSKASDADLALVDQLRSVMHTLLQSVPQKP